MSVDVLIAAVEGDRDRAAAVADKIRALGRSCDWADLGSDIQTRRAKADTAKAVVAIWSAASIDNAAIADIAENALDANALISVLLDDAQVPLAFRHVPRIDMRAGDAAELEPLAGLLEEVSREGGLNALGQGGSETADRPAKAAAPAKDMPMNALPIGTEFDGYRVDDILGVGGFGITYLATEGALGREVAIKEYMPRDLATRGTDSRTVKPQSTESGEDFQWGLDRFRREAQLLVDLHHPSIVPVLRFFEANGTAYMVMAYQKGASLGEILKSGAILEQSEIEEILYPLLDGLAQVHSKGFLHRDLKPSNIYIRSDGSPVLLDFGAARQAIGGRSAALTSIVSAGYAPPEQYSSDAADQGPWTDIYGLGQVLYRAITGNQPLAAPQRAAAVLSGRPDPQPPLVEVAGDGYDPNLLRAVDAAIAISHHDRTQSIDDFRAMLKGGAETADAAVAPSRETGDDTLMAWPASARTDSATLAPRAGPPAQAESAAQPPAGPQQQAQPVQPPGAKKSWLKPVGLVAAVVLLMGGAAAGVYVFIDSQNKEKAELARKRDAAKAALDAAAKAIAAGNFDEAEKHIEKAAGALPDAAGLKETRRKLEEARKRANADAVRKRREAAERARREEAERKRREEAERKRRADAERKRREDAERNRKAEAERKRREDAERNRTAEAERKRREEAERRRKEEAERKGREEAGNAQTYLRRGHEAYRRRAYAQALNWYRRGALAGNAAAMRSVGWMYQKGLGTARNYATAFRWYLRAANLGNAAAMNDVGFLYNQGWGVPRNPALAVRWYLRSAGRGNAYAMYNLGASYERGSGVPRNITTALMWYRRAAAKGHPGARQRIRVLTGRN
jgi:serine/threonine protein kinase/TPR repeat protein